MGKKVTVSFELGRTISLGDFENVKILVGMDVRTDEDEVSIDYEHAKKWVSARMQEEEEKWKSEKK